MLTILIDGDMFCFRACSACEHEINWGNDIWTLHVDLAEAKVKLVDLLDTAIENGLKAMKYDGHYQVNFCFSSSYNFRKEILATYKANRAGKRKPVGYKALVSWVKDNFTFTEQKWLEADDCIGILATLPTVNDNTLILSGDKDMKCIYGHHYDFIHEEYSYVNKDEAQYHFFMQTLMGDATDGYSGCPKIGKVNAKRILDKDCSWDAIKQAYAKAGLSEEYALTQARVAKILLSSDYDINAKKVKLWKPIEHH